MGDEQEVLTDGFAAYADDLAAKTWREMVNRTDVAGTYYADRLTGEVCQMTWPACRRRGLDYLSLDFLASGFRGKRTIGLHAGSPGPKSLARWFGIDVDAHDDEADPEANVRGAFHWYETVLSYGLQPLLVASNGAGGYHLWVVFREPLPLAAAYIMARFVVRDYPDHGLKAPVETFPKQFKLDPPGGDCQFGNWLRLSGKHHKRPWWSRIWDGGRWASGADAARAFLATEPADPTRLLADATRFASELPRPEPPRPFRFVVEGDTAHVVRRARSHVAKMDLSNQGQPGSDRVLAVACQLVRDWALDADDAWPVLVEYNATRANPPWSETLLLRKLSEAIKITANQPRGRLRQGVGR